MKKNNKELFESTKLVHDERYAEGAVAPPIYQTSLFSFEDYQSMVDRYRGDSDQAIYSRIDNPTTRVLQNKIAMLEGGDAAAAFSSGMAAISNTILSVAHVGDRIVCIRHVYPDTYRLLRGLCNRLGIVAEFVDGTDTEAVANRLHGAKLLYLVGTRTREFIAFHGRLRNDHGAAYAMDRVGHFHGNDAGCADVEYAPWAIFCITGPMFSLILAATFSRTGFGLRLLER